MIWTQNPCNIGCLWSGLPLMQHEYLGAFTYRQVPVKFLKTYVLYESHGVKFLKTYVLYESHGFNSRSLKNNIFMVRLAFNVTWMFRSIHL
jgi:hypothetical protein